MHKKQFKTSLILIIMLFITMLVVSGGTFAYLQWQTTTDQRTELSVSVTDDIKMTIDPAAETKTGMRPTNNCGGDYAMSGTSTVTITNNTGVLARPRFKLKIKITDSSGNNITNVISAMDANDGNGSTNKPYMYYIKYAVAESNGSCTNPIMEGRFSGTTETTSGSGWYDSPTLTLDDEDGFPDRFSSVSFNAQANAVTSYTYKVVVWIDSGYTTLVTGNDISSDKLQNATITVSWSENSTVEQIRDKKAYAVYSSDDTSLRFYRSDVMIEEGSTYNGKIATAVYTGFEDESYSSMNSVPWYSNRSSITSVVFEDYIMPISTANWFYPLTFCANFDVEKLNTSNVTDMSRMFSMAGYNESDSFEITGMENWNTSNVINMYSMFGSSGRNAAVFDIGDISDWDVSNVTNMNEMFYDAGYNADYTLNLSNWNVCKVTSYTNFKQGVTDKITEPSWGMSCST